VGRTSLLQPTSPRRRIEVVEVDLATIVAAAHAQGATVNDMLLVAVGGALRRLLVARGEQLDEVLISVPVSGRPAASSSDLGNQVGVLPVAVPLAEDPAVRLAAVRDQRARLGTSAPRASSGAVLSVLFRGLAALGIFQWFVRRQRLVHTFLTNLRGPTQPLALAGSHIRRLVPIATVPGNVTVSFDVRLTCPLTSCRTSGLHIRDPPILICGTAARGCRRPLTARPGTAAARTPSQAVAVCDGRRADGAR
jgi:diacylglycerol O-acyltransferase / wax synthase